jgi:hypothetical protein
MLIPEGVPDRWQDLEEHPIASLFPLMEGAGRQSLLEDIRDNGFDHYRPIGLLDGKILDGRNRHSVCVELDQSGVLREAPAFARFQGVTGRAPALEWAVSVNLNRRHLTEAQRAVVAAKVLPLLEKAAKERQRASGEQHGRGQEKVPANLPEPIGGKGEAREHAAKQLNVSPRSVQTAKQLIEKAPDLAEKVAAGQLSLNGATNQMKEREGGASRPSPDLTKVVRGLVKRFTTEEVRDICRMAMEAIGEKS